MANVLINDQYLSDIATAIRIKTGSTDTYKPKEMAAAIKDISSFNATGLTFDALLTTTDDGEFYSETAESIPDRYMKNQPIYSATGKKVNTIGESAFIGCTKLQSINFPVAQVLKAGAFDGCVSLIDVSLPKVTTIYEAAFTGCKNLEKLDLPNVSSFPDNQSNTFAVCNKLTHLILRRSGVCSLPTLSYAYPSQFRTGLAWIYVPAAYYDAYVNQYKSKLPNFEFRKIEDYPDICG